MPKSDQLLPGLAAEGFMRHPGQENSQQQAGVDHAKAVSGPAERSLLAELAEARESYRLANRRIIELLDEKIALQARFDKQFEDYLYSCADEAVQEKISELAATLEWIQNEVGAGFISCASCGRETALSDIDLLGKIQTLSVSPAAILAARNKPLREALEASLKLQSHYAGVLNTWDGGQRIRFENADSWLARLEEVKQDYAAWVAPESKP